MAEAAQLLVGTRGVILGVSQNYGYPSGVPIIRIIVFWGLYWVPQNTGEFFQDDQCLQTDHNSRTQIQGW